MPDTAFKPASYEDILALPEGVVGEILNGVLHTQPRPRPRHAIAATRLASRISSGFDTDDGGPGGWLIVAEPEIHFADAVLVPDIAGWRTATLTALPDGAHFTQAPDWVCEVLSPSTESKDRALKAEIYLAAGVAHMWLLDPEARYLEAFSAREEGWLRLGAVSGDDEVALAPFAESPFKLARLWLD